MITKDEILQVLKDNKNLFKTKYGVEKIGLFGSYAKDIAKNDSDIDIYVKFSRPKFDYIAGLWNFLEEKYQKKVDLYRENRFSNGEIYKKIKEETIFI